MHRVQKCNENSLVFFSLTLNNRNHWDCLGMLEFVCCLPKLGMILCYFSSLCLNKPASLWKTRCNRLPSPPSKSSPRTCICICLVWNFPSEISISRFPHAFFSWFPKQIQPSFQRLDARLNPKYVRNVCSVCTETWGLGK